MTKSKWEKYFDIGIVSNDELDEMIEETQMVINYCEARGDRFFLMAAQCNRDLGSLKLIKHYRQNK